MSYIGTYERTIFYNPSNKYCIIRVKSSDQSIPQQARSAYRHRDNMIRFIAVGYELPQTDKVSMILDGEWESGKHGVQLQVERCEEIVPQTKEGVFGYLSSRLIKGVGEKTAALIVSRFGADALRVLEKEPERLLEIRGITPDKLEDIKASYAESRCVRDLMILLTPFNVTPTTAMKIYEHFGSRSVDILQKNPYELCQVSGFGFKRVDAIVRKGTVPLNSPMRIHGAVFAALDTQRSEKGHLYLDETALAKVSVKLLNENTPDGQIKVTPEEVGAVIQDMILKGEIVSSNGNIYQINCFIQEDETARKIAEMLAVPPVELDISDSLEFVRKNLGIALSQRQSEAVYMAFRSNLSIITGSPGTGKTTVLRAIIEVFQMLYPKGKIMLAAPTGRASRRMAESTGRNEAKTLHSLLGLLGDSEPINKDKQKEPLDADLIIVDESSMIDMWLARQFFQRIRPGTRVILVGDVDQLQSVGAGDVFRELIDSGLIPVTVLNEIFRQKKGSIIAYNAKRINEANIDLQYGEDFQFVKCQTQEEAADLKIGSCYFRQGDKVMQTKNNAKASNGDIGYIRKMGRNEENEMMVTIEFSGNRTVEYGMEEMTHMELAYATTVHKAMGSEFDIVIMPVLRSHYIMLNRNIVYTAITRAKEQVIPVGQKKALVMAILKKTTGKRNTLLGERIGKYLKAFARQNELKKVS